MKHTYTPHAEGCIVQRAIEDGARGIRNLSNRAAIRTIVREQRLSEEEETDLLYALTVATHPTLATIREVAAHLRRTHNLRHADVCRVVNRFKDLGGR